MILTPNPVNANIFTFHDGKFTTEMSDLPKSFEISRVYDDAWDGGFASINHETGNVCVFRLESIDHDPEGDIEGWQFSCIKPTRLTHLKALIIND